MPLQRPTLTLHPVDCDACGRCATVCRQHAIRPGPNYIYVDWSLCDGCGKCIDVCDRGAIESRGGAPAASGAAKVPSGGLVIGAGASSQADPRVRWTLPEAAVVLVVAVALQAAMQMVLASGTVRSLATDGTMLAKGGALALYYVAEIAVLLLLAGRRGVRFAAAYRLDAPPDLLSVPLGLSMLAATWLFSMLYRAAAISAGWRPPASDSPSLTQLFGSDAAGMILTVLVVVLLGPVVEELLLRGVVLTALQARIGRWWGIAISALMFATLHGSLWSFVPLTFLGLALGRLASDRRSLWPAVGLHVLYNAVIVLPAFLIAART